MKPKNILASAPFFISSNPPGCIKREPSQSVTVVVVVSSVFRVACPSFDSKLCPLIMSYHPFYHFFYFPISKSWRIKLSRRILNFQELLKSSTPLSFQVKRAGSVKARDGNFTDNPNPALFHPSCVCLCDCFACSTSASSARPLLHSSETSIPHPPRILSS